MQVGRNDPCPCGSGKKYKKCCMEKVRILEREARTMISTPPKLKQKTWADFEHLKINDVIEDDFDEEDPDNFVDPRQISLFGEDEFPPIPQQLLRLADEEIEDDELDDEDLDNHWEEFERANYENKITIFLNTLDEKKLIDNDEAFEMLSAIQTGTRQRNQQDRFFSLLDKVEHDFPDVYDADAGYYLEWKIMNAVFHSRRDDVIRLLNEFAPRAGQDIDVFNNVADMLAYHGYQAPFLDAFKVGWKTVAHSKEIVSWGINDFAERTIDFLIFEHIESHPENNPNDKELIKTAKNYLPDILVDEFINFVGLPPGKSKRNGP